MKTAFFLHAALSGIFSTVALWAAAPAQTLAEASKLSSPFERARALRDLTAQADAKTCAVDFAQAQALSGALRTECLAAVVSRWAKVDAPAALAACLNAAPAYRQREALRALFTAWAQSSPQDAFDALAKHLNRAPYSQMLEGFIEGYAQKDPAAAFAFFAQQRAKNPWLNADMKTVFDIIIPVWARRDPQAALQTMSAYAKAERLNLEFDDYLDFSELLESWFAERPRELRRTLSALPADERNDFLKKLSVSQKIPFAQVPELVEIFQQLGGKEADSLIGEQFVRLAQRDWKASLPLAMGLGEGEAKRQSVQIVFQVWAQSDFDAAMAQAQKLPDDSLRRKVMGTIWNEHVCRKPVLDQLALLPSITDPALRRQMTGEIASLYLLKGGDIGMLMQRLPDIQAQREFLLSLGDNRRIWVSEKKAKESLRQWLMILPPSEARSQLLLDSFYGEKSMDDLLWINEHMTPLEARNLFTFTGLDSPAFQSLLTPDQFEKLPDGVLRSYVLEEMVKKMAASDPNVAARFVYGLPPSRERDQVFHRYLEQLEQRGNRELFLQALEHPPAGSEVLWFPYYEAANGMAKTDPAQAIVWALRQQEGQSREQALAGVAGGWDIQKSKEFFAQMAALSGQVDTTNAINTFLNQWSEQDAKGAAQWLLQNPTATKENAASVFYVWIESDPMGATQWMKTLPEGAVRNGAIQSLVNSPEAEKSPEAAMSWVMSVPVDTGEATTRVDMLKALVSQARRGDPAAAKALLNNPQVTDAERAAMQKELVKVEY